MERKNSDEFTVPLAEPITVTTITAGTKSPGGKDAPSILLQRRWRSGSRLAESSEAKCGRLLDIERGAEKETHALRSIRGSNR